MRERALRHRFGPWAGALCALALVWAVSAPAQAGELRDVRVGLHPGLTRVVFDFNEPVTFGHERQRLPDGSERVELIFAADARRRVVSARNPLTGPIQVTPQPGAAVVRVKLQRSGLEVVSLELQRPYRVVLDVIAPGTALPGWARPANVQPRAVAWADTLLPVVPTPDPLQPAQPVITPDVAAPPKGGPAPRAGVAATNPSGDPGSAESPPSATPVPLGPPAPASLPEVSAPAEPSPDSTAPAGAHPPAGANTPTGGSTPAGPSAPTGGNTPTEADPPAGATAPTGASAPAGATPPSAASPADAEPPETAPAATPPRRESSAPIPDPSRTADAAASSDPAERAADAEERAAVEAIRGIERRLAEADQGAAAIAPMPPAGGAAPEAAAGAEGAPHDAPATRGGLSSTAGLIILALLALALLVTSVALWLRARQVARSQALLLPEESSDWEAAAARSGQTRFQVPDEWIEPATVESPPPETADPWVPAEPVDAEIGDPTDRPWRVDGAGDEASQAVHDAAAPPDAAPEPRHEPGPEPAPVFPADELFAVDEFELESETGSREESPMSWNADSPLDPAAGDHKSDAFEERLRQLEARLSHAETRIVELTDERDRLRQQLSAHTEELRVQRAAIARTQRVVRRLIRPRSAAATGISSATAS